MARTPLYKVVETEMIRRIEAGEWEVGRRLPNEFGLAEEFSVSQGTMRRALITLEGLGLLDRKPGRGTLVAARRIPVAEPGRCGLVGLRGADVTFEIYRAASATRQATAAKERLFGNNARMSVLGRVLICEGRRAALDEVSVPETLIPALAEDGPVDLGSTPINSCFNV